ncbi:heavy metal sensor histidine kinase [Paludisphaera borealis]|uniref:histidine kinase n=1 Tax=Paludisphaera borealis TaxID=1387353 RepID=A0A1U7CVK1_9BACT|nr:heavy metal sensor histidine kinase [Paludisphaera borealis]APW62972.1 Sensor kinase CusS [Paludisphaera borealis]
MNRLPIRWRLTLWYGVVLSAILIVFSGTVYLLMRRHLLALTDAGLAEEVVEVGDELGRIHHASKVSRLLGLRFAKHEGFEHLVTDAAGKVLFQSDSDVGPWPSGKAVEGLDRLAYQTVDMNRIGHARLVSRRVAGPEGPVTIQTVVSLAPNDRALRELVTILLTIGPIALGGTLGGGYWLARKGLAPVDRMVAAAAEITSSRLDRRLETGNSRDELGRLAHTFNDMIARLQISFEEVRRFTADAAHELRTPLSMMRTEAEVALRAPRSPSQDARVFESVLEETERLGRLVTQMLFLCREDAGIATGDQRPVVIDDLIREVADHMRVAADEKGLTLKADARIAGRVVGDPDRLRQILFNLLDNAIKYTPPGGEVAIRGESPNGCARIIVADTGVGVAPEHLPHLFDRFYRVDSSRGNETGGTGLGLAICRAIAEAHGGRIHIESEFHRGTRAVLTLPIATPAEHADGPTRRAQTLGEVG